MDSVRRLISDQTYDFVAASRTMPGPNAPGQGLFDESVLGKTVEYVHTILRRELSAFVALG